MMHGAIRIAQRLPGPIGRGLLALNLLGLVGFVVRDRTVILALLFYIPLLPIGFVALVLDLACRGRVLRRPRFLLSAVGLAAVVCSGSALIGRGPATPARGDLTAGSEIRLLHWNVWWGGWPHTDATWTSIEETILARRPDVVVLSEAPTDTRLDSLRRRLGPGWSSTRVERGAAKPGYYYVAVLSRWPVRNGPRVAIRNGIAVETEVEHPGRTLRMLVIDGVSQVTRLRTPMMHDIASACRKAATSGRPFDVVVGDFNTPGRSVAFEALRLTAGGYEPAAHASTDWRGTWPMLLPVYDIDHVCVHRGVLVRSCRLFTNLASDHRGQIVQLALPGHAPKVRARRITSPPPAY